MPLPLRPHRPIGRPHRAVPVAVPTGEPRRHRPSPIATGVAVVFAALGCAGSAQAADACSPRGIPAAEYLLDVPFDTVDSRIYVDARVDGRGPFRFAVDTGASGLARADASLATQLGAPRGGATSTSDGVRSATVETTRLRSIALGALEHRDLDVITRDYRARVSPQAAFAGILARDFFADGLLEIDYPARRLRFSRSHTLAADARGALPYERAFRIPVTIGDVEATAQLDTGADVVLVLPRALYDRVSTAPLADAGGATLTNGRIATQHGPVRGPVRIGGLRLADVTARVSSDFPEMLVGAPALAGSRVLIDQRTKRVAVCGPSGVSQVDAPSPAGTVPSHARTARRMPPVAAAPRD